MKALIMAAGEGERLRPLTYTRSKVMLQVAGKPILHHLLLELKKVGVSEAVVVVRYLKQQIIDYFARNDIGIKLTFVMQGERKGTAAAILAAEDYFDDTFLVVAGDIVTEASVIENVINSHKKSITVGVKKVGKQSEYGIVELAADGSIALIEEKPAHPKSDLVNISIYCMEPTVFDAIKTLTPSPRGEYEITDLLVGANAAICEGFWTDIGYPWHLFDANDWLLSRMQSETNGSIEKSTINGKVILEKNAEIIDSYIEGMSYIGEGTKVGPNACLRGNNSIGKNCEVGESTTVKNSILFDNVKAKHLTYIGDSIVGENVNFGSGTQLANFRFDENTINVLTERGWVNSGRKKLGAIIGDNTKLGVLSCVMPGKFIGNNCWVGSGAVVGQNIPPHTHVFIKQELVFAKEKKDAE
jgi:bifunctional UDP-N-acetylglucosamine pyrophosphorylase/glucosamine-1-phosphate N-acetyltransferase